MGLEDAPWWDEMLAIRNDHSLVELAAKFGVSAGQLALALRLNNESRTSPNTPQVDENSEPTGEGGERPNSKDFMLDPLRGLMGTISDADVARRAGVSMRTVAAYRKRHTIDAYEGRGKPKARFRKSKIDPFIDIVGKLPDREVALRAGVTLNAVRNYRTNRGIASSRTYAREQRELARAARNAPVSMATSPTTVTAPSPAVVPAQSWSQQPARAASALPTGAFAWRITFDGGVSGVVTAGDAASAAHAGQAHNANIIQIERLGRLL